MKSSKNKKSYSWVKAVIVLVGVLSAVFVVGSFFYQNISLPMMRMGG
ncbi:hypothetical protein [Candidatus Thiothrix anitrata]|jgi:hypothetical protein|uniref:Uncharacterized protein n=1 Tax=Candidatus Thiothrix anitrata TaxID=2823902 RepID=A0ABX7X8J6_9GAMM|nr:hypothetical protein [Candidatus Thiothrix anitrata]QTR51550.1 hypothetical protein J8380_08430 [Candidatus Thiothrix anitrata]